MLAPTFLIYGIKTSELNDLCVQVRQIIILENVSHLNVN